MAVALAAEQLHAGACAKEEELDVEALIKEFLADGSRTTLELPHMTTGQRKQTKKLVEQHPGLRCESFGFGQERQLHLFKASQEAAAGKAAAEALPSVQEQAGGSGAAARARAPVLQTPKTANSRGVEQNWEASTTEEMATMEACSTTASTHSSPGSSPRSGALLRNVSIGKPPGLTTPLGVAAVRNTFIHFDSDKSDERQVQSMPHGMFRQCLWAEALSESVAEQALLSPSATKEEPTLPEAPAEQHLEVPASARPGLHEEEVAAAVPPTVQEEQVDAPAQSQLAAGTEVEIAGLSKAPQFNGRRAIVQSFDSASGRYDVGMWNTTGEQKAKVKRENLIPVAPLSFTAPPFTPSGSFCELLASTAAPGTPSGYPWPMPVQSPVGQFLQAR